MMHGCEIVDLHLSSIICLQVRGIDWNFNAWGGLESGLYYPWDLDDAVPQKVLEIEGMDRYEAPIVLEGGSIHVDGEGTLITTEECLLNPNRNPTLTKNEIEQSITKLFECFKDHLAWQRGI